MEVYEEVEAAPSKDKTDRRRRGVPQRQQSEGDVAGEAGRNDADKLLRREMDEMLSSEEKAEFEATRQAFRRIFSEASDPSLLEPANQAILAQFDALIVRYQRRAQEEQDRTEQATLDAIDIRHRIATEAAEEDIEQDQLAKRYTALLRRPIPPILEMVGAFHQPLDATFQQIVAFMATLPSRAKARDELERVDLAECTRAYDAAAQRLVLFQATLDKILAYRAAFVGRYDTAMMDTLRRQMTRRIQKRNKRAADTTEETTGKKRARQEERAAPSQAASGSDRSSNHNAITTVNAPPPLAPLDPLLCLYPMPNNPFRMARIIGGESLRERAALYQTMSDTPGFMVIHGATLYPTFPYDLFRPCPALSLSAPCVLFETDLLFDVPQADAFADADRFCLLYELVSTLYQASLQLGFRYNSVSPSGLKCIAAQEARLYDAVRCSSACRVTLCDLAVATLNTPGDTGSLSGADYELLEALLVAYPIADFTHKVRGALLLEKTIRFEALLALFATCWEERKQLL